MLTFHLHFADIGIFLFDTSYLFLYASFLKQQQWIQLGIKIKDIYFFLSFFLCQNYFSVKPFIFCIFCYNFLSQKPKEPL